MAANGSDDVFDIDQQKKDGNVPVSNDNASLWSMDTRKICCLMASLITIDIFLIVSTALNLVHHDTKLWPWRNTSAICIIIYRIAVIFISKQFMDELLQGGLSIDDCKSLNMDKNTPLIKKRTAIKSKHNFATRMEYFFKDCQLNQFSIPYIICAANQLYCAYLIFMAVINQTAHPSYILTAFTYFLGSFSIPLPGICFNQFAIYKHKQRKTDLKSEYDEGMLYIT